MKVPFFRQLSSRLSRNVTSGKFIPEIDGLRFLAISLVILHHIQTFFLYKSTVTYADRDAFQWLADWLYDARKGVELFFVISGFILALPFARSFLAGAPAPSVKRYFLRRLTRLEPPYILALLVMFVLLVAFTGMPAGQASKSLLASLIYSHNIIFDWASYLLPVAWSLELEVHFYLLAPLLFLSFKLPLLLRRGMLISVILALPWIQAPHFTWTYYLFYYIQYFLTGILLADFYLKRPAAGLPPVAASLAGGLLLSLLLAYPHIQTHLLQGETQKIWYATFFPVVIGLFYYVVLTNSFWKRAFSLKWITVIGGMCYSIYLVHQPILSVMMKLLIHRSYFDSYPLDLLLVTVICLPVVLTGGGIFFLLIEKPCMNPQWPAQLLARIRPVRRR